MRAALSCGKPASAGVPIAPDEFRRRRRLAERKASPWVISG